MKPPQHHRKRGYCKMLASVLRHVEAARCGYDDALWLFYHIAGLRSRLDRAEGELKGMRENVGALKRECHYWKHQFGEWDRELEEARADLAATTDDLNTCRGDMAAAWKENLQLRQQQDIGPRRKL